MCQKCEFCGVRLVNEYDYQMLYASDEEKKKLEELYRKDPESVGRWSCVCPHCRKGGCGDCT